jgi:hypothetical protein
MNPFIHSLDWSSSGEFVLYLQCDVQLVTLAGCNNMKTYNSKNFSQKILILLIKEYGSSTRNWICLMLLLVCR